MFMLWYRFSKTKGIESDPMLIPISGIALLSIINKTYLSSNFVVVGPDFWRAKYEKLL